MTMTIVPPQRTERQRTAALKRANEVRSIRAALKAELRDGTIDPAQVLAEIDPDLATMRVYDVLCALPYHGHVKATAILAHCDISLHKTIGGLSVRQRHALLDRLAGR